jgi:hypothetical protein
VTQYLVLIYGSESGYAQDSQQAWDELHAEHTKFWQNNPANVLGGNALEATATATSIRREGGGEPTVTDGPFAETKEALGGYYLIEAADLDEAIAIAKQVPAPYGGVEVRPVLVLS